jgi:Ca-activated chloride channel family protein
MKKLIFAISAVLIFISCESENSERGYYNLDPSLSSGEFMGNHNGNSGTEQYNEILENNFIAVADEPVSTFSIDADGAAYSNLRRLINNNWEIPKGAVRIEEMINYFQYDYEEPNGVHPISLNGEVSSCPWTSGNKLLRIGIKGQTIQPEDYPASNIVFLIDVSGSMGSDDKLELLKDGFQLFVDQIRPKDKISIVTYASNPGVLLESTSGDEKAKIKEAINSLGAGGSTNGEGGILTAYEIAQVNFIEGGNNRIILGTDGDFNVGVSGQEELITLIEEKREEGVFLTVLGVGSGNLQEGKMEQIANHGNGTFEYIDNLDQARKVFIEEYGKFFTVAKDVKVQIEFNNQLVEKYRLIGYENRVLNEEDFEDDDKDAGEIGAGQTITALYEIIPAETNIDPRSQPTFAIDFRYKDPDKDVSIPLALDVVDQLKSFHTSSENMRFAASVGAFGMLLLESEHKGNVSYNNVLNWANLSSTFDPFSYRQGFMDLVEKVK